MLQNTNQFVKDMLFFVLEIYGSASFKQKSKNKLVNCNFYSISWLCLKEMDDADRPKELKWKPKPFIYLLWTERNKRLARQQKTRGGELDGAWNTTLRRRQTRRRSLNGLGLMR